MKSGDLPHVAALELTSHCNHLCIFCSCPWEHDFNYVNEELSLEEWKDIISILLNKGVKTFTLTGGEPLTRPDIKELIAFIHSQNVNLVLISNGRAMDDGMLKYLAEHQVKLCISVPGIRTFQEHTGVDNINHVLGLFEKAASIGMNITANIAVTKKNLPELYENIALPLIRGAHDVLLNRFLPGGRGLNNTEYLLNIEETNQMLDIAETVLRKANRYGHVGTELPLCAINNPDKYQHLHIGNICSAAKDFFIVDPSGYIKVCNHSPERICHYTQIDSIAANEYWSRFRYRDYLPEMCKKCKFNDICDGGCREAAHVYSGSITAPDPLFVCE